MSTTYTIIDKGTFKVEMTESSSKLSLELTAKDGLNTWGEGNATEASVPADLTEDDVIRMIVEMAKCASYVSGDPDAVRGKIIMRLAAEQGLFGPGSLEDLKPAGLATKMVERLLGDVSEQDVEKMVSFGRNYSMGGKKLIDTLTARTRHSEPEVQVLKSRYPAKVGHVEYVAMGDFSQVEVRILASLLSGAHPNYLRAMLKNETLPEALADKVREELTKRGEPHD